MWALVFCFFVLIEIQHGWHWATADEWQNATLVLVPLGGRWHNNVDGVVWLRDFVLPVCFSYL